MRWPKSAEFRVSAYMYFAPRIERIDPPIPRLVISYLQRNALFTTNQTKNKMESARSKKCLIWSVTLYLTRVCVCVRISSFW